MLPGAPTTPDLNEAQLVAGLRAGEDAAFEQLLRTYGGRYLAVARRMMGDDADAADAVQDAMLSALKNISKFEGGSSVGTWLHRIVINACLMRLRTRRRRGERSIEDLLPTFDEGGHPSKTPVSWNPAPSAGIESRETSEMVRRAIDELPEGYRTVVLLRDIEGLSTEETAVMLGTNANTVKIRLHRARQALRELLDPKMRQDDSEGGAA
jgi:RNA polymerase sigma-70 factor (ECF subfamily)